MGLTRGQVVVGSTNNIIILSELSDDMVCATNLYIYSIRFDSYRDLNEILSKALEESLNSKQLLPIKEEVIEFYKTNVLQDTLDFIKNKGYLIPFIIMNLSF